MARRVKFPLDMGNENMVRSIEELKEYYDTEKVTEYFLNGKLLTWLEDRYYDEEAEQVKKLSEMSDKKKAAAMLPEVFNVKIEEEVDVEAVELRNEKLKKLRDITSDDEILDNVDFVAFSQEELGDLLDEEAKVIYLFGENFRIPLSVKNVRYVGVNNPTITISGSDEIDLEVNGIVVERCSFSAETMEKINDTMKKNNERFVIERNNSFAGTNNYSAQNSASDYSSENHTNDFEIKEQYGKMFLKRYKGNSQNVIIPDNICKIGASAFSTCRDIKTVVIPESVTEIESYAFMYCSSLTSIVIPKNVTVISASAFYGCERLVNVDIPYGVSTIEKNAFSGCYDLVNLYLPDSISEIGEGAFDWCSKIKIGYKNRNYSYDEIGDLCRAVKNISPSYKTSTNTNDFEITDNGYKVCLKKYKGNSEVVKIPDNVNVIGREAFYNCKRVKKIIIPDNVFEIGGWAFSKCENLESINIPNGITKIDYNTFEDCKSLTEIYLPHNLNEIRANAFYGCDSFRLKIIYHNRTYSISQIDILYGYIKG